MIKLKNILIEVMAPHAGRELELMLSGRKPAALIGELEYNEFKPYVQSGKFISKSIILADETIWIVSQPKESWRINQIVKIFKWKKKVKKGLDIELKRIVGKKLTNLYHAKLGLLLGYDKKDIRDFLKYTNS